MTDPGLAELLAEREINRLQLLYSALCDQGFPADQIADLFTVDGVWESEPGRRVTGRSAIVEHFRDAGPNYPWSMHINIPLGVDLDPDGHRARGAWHLLMPCVDRTLGRPVAGWLAGRYDNIFVRQDGRWRIQHLRIHFELMAPHLADWAGDRFLHQPGRRIPSSPSPAGTTAPGDDPSHPGGTSR